MFVHISVRCRDRRLKEAWTGEQALSPVAIRFQDRERWYPVQSIRQISGGKQAKSRWQRCCVWLSV